jgi:hypothetical protein
MSDFSPRMRPGEREIDGFVTAWHGSDEGFSARLDPAHGGAQAQRNVREEDLLRIWA